MLTVNTNITSIITQNHLTMANNSLQKSIERLSTGFRINRASDDAANLAVSKNMECQISGTKVAQDNVQQGVNLLQTADSTLDGMQDIAQRIRELSLQSLNGTYSNEERAMMQEEVRQLTNEIYQQKNNAKFNQISIFGEDEYPPVNSVMAGNPSPASAGATAASNSGTVGAFDPTHEITTDAEAEAAGYTAIHNAAEFANIKNDLTKKYVLMGDIDFSQVSGWGNVTTESGFELNGNGYAIKNLVIDSSTNSSMNGLFDDIVSGSTVKNLNMENVSIDSSQDNIGALCGGVNWDTYGTIENCTVSGNIKGSYNTGGLVGEFYGTITSCSSSATVTGTSNTGGLVGISSGTITSCSSSATVTGDYSTGGLVGSSQGTITSCSSSATVTGTGNNTGGLVGDLYSGTITSCSSSATVTGTGNITGGLVGGSNGATIDKSYATGNVISTGNLVGGLAGYQNNGKISNSYATDNVTGNDKVGGLTGENCGGDGIISSYSTGTVTGTGDNVGGFVGANGSKYGSTGNIQNSYSTSTTDFIGNNIEPGTVTNNHSAGNATISGVENHDANWFNDGNNLTFLGSAYDTSVIPPELWDNRREPPSPPTGKGIQLQVGANSGEDNTLSVSTEFSLNGFYGDVSTREKADETLKKVDNLINELSTMRSNCGAIQNRLESVQDTLTTQVTNLSASHSTIVDTDYSAESAKLVKEQILENITSTLLAQANANPSIALRLLE